MKPSNGRLRFPRFLRFPADGFSAFHSCSTTRNRSMSAFSSTNPMAGEEANGGVTVLPAVEDKYGGVVTETSCPMDPSVFSALLRFSLFSRILQLHHSSPSVDVAPRRPMNLDQVPRPHVMDSISWTALTYCLTAGLEFTAIVAQVADPKDVSFRVQLMSLLLNIALCLLIAANFIYAKTHPKMALGMDRVGSAIVLISLTIAALPSFPEYVSITCAGFMIILYAHQYFSSPAQATETLKQQSEPTPQPATAESPPGFSTPSGSRPPVIQHSSPHSSPSPRHSMNFANQLPPPHVMDNLSWTALTYCLTAGLEFTAIAAQVADPKDVSFRVQLVSLLLTIALCLLIAANFIYAKTHPKMALRMDRVGSVIVLISSTIAALPSFPEYVSIACAGFMIILYAHQHFMHGDGNL